jgi:hypothetical protein
MAYKGTILARISEKLSMNRSLPNINYLKKPYLMGLKAPNILRALIRARNFHGFSLKDFLSLFIKFLANL